MKACVVQLKIVALAILSGCYSGSRPKGIGRVPRPFDLADATKKLGAPFFAPFAKGGYHGPGIKRFFSVSPW